MSEERMVIKLSDRAPVSIVDSEWELIARADNNWHDNEFEFQANRKKWWYVAVLRHSDGRVIVYASYAYDTSYSGEDNVRCDHGTLIDNEIAANIRHLPREIQRVCLRMGEETGDIDTWRELYNEAVQSLPAEEL